MTQQLGLLLILSTVTLKLCKGLLFSDQKKARNLPPAKIWCSTVLLGPRNPLLRKINQSWGKSEFWLEHARPSKNAWKCTIGLQLILALIDRGVAKGVRRVVRPPFYASGSTFFQTHFTTSMHWCQDCTTLHTGHRELTPHAFETFECNGDHNNIMHLYFRWDGIPFLYHNTNYNGHWCPQWGAKRPENELSPDTWLS
jgi:hypothetical protein